MRCQAAGFRFLKLQRESRVLVEIYAPWILHGLHCGRCAIRDEAERLLALAGVTEEEFIQGCWDTFVEAAGTGGDRGQATDTGV